MNAPLIPTNDRYLIRPPVPPLFGFLPQADIGTAGDSYITISGILAQAPHPQAIFIDVDDTLYNGSTKGLIPRTIGAAFAFHNAGVPVGIYSLRPRFSISKFLSEHPQISSVLGFLSSGEPLIMAKEDLISFSARLVAGSDIVSAKTEERPLHRDSRMMVRVPKISIVRTDGEVHEMDFPKVAPASNVLILDDYNFFSYYDVMIRILGGRLPYDFPLIKAIRFSIAALWHVEKGDISDGFLSAHIDSLTLLLEGLAKKPVVETATVILPEVEEPEEKNVGTHRQLYITQFGKMPLDERVEAARSATGNDLIALCYDPTIEVIRVVVENMTFGLQHARIIAAHHPNIAGLELATRRHGFLRDRGIRNGILQNQVSDRILIERVLNPLSLAELHNYTMGREATQRAKRTAHEVFVQKFRNSSGEDQARFIIRNEGRCLEKLRDVRLKQKAIDILARHQYRSTQLANNLLVYPFVTSTILGQMLKSTMVRRSSHMRQKIRSHPKCPTESKPGV